MALRGTEDKSAGDTSYYRLPMCVTSAHSVRGNDQSEGVTFLRLNVLCPLLFILSGLLQLDAQTHWIIIAEDIPPDW